MPRNFLGMAAMMIRPITLFLAVVLGIGGVLAGDVPASASELVITGFVTDAVTGALLPGVCVARDMAGSQCFEVTSSGGSFVMDAGSLGATPRQTWDLYFLKTGYLTAYSDKFILRVPVRLRQVLAP